MNPIAISIVTVATEASKTFITNKHFEPDANLSSLDSPPKSITEIKGDALREKRLKDWVFTQGIKLEQSVLVKRQAALDTAGRKWWTAKLVGWAIGGIDIPPVTMAGPNELELLTGLFDLLTNKYSSYTLMAKGGQDFALPFLVGRAMALDIGLPSQLASSYPVSDIHGIFGRSAQSTQRGTMTDYSFGLGLPIVENRESPQFLYDQYQLGNQQALQQLQTQCADEVKLIAEMMRRFHKRYVNLKDVPKSDDIPF